jgi:hypothetical protein
VNDDYHVKTKEQINLLANENDRLTEWVYLLEAFIKLTTPNLMAGSEWGRQKARLVPKRPEFLKPGAKPLG